MPIILNGTTGITTPGITNTGPFTFQGVVELPAGAVGAPSLTTTGDTNTGIYFPAADTIGFVEGGVEALRINSSAQIAVNTAGTAGAPVITKTDDLNTGIFFPAADTIAFTEGGVESMRIDASGNMGLGVTPSAWNSTWKALDIDERVSLASAGNKTTILANNAVFDSVGWKYKASQFAGAYAISTTTGNHEWNIAPTGTAGNAITFTQAMTLDASANLGINTTTPALTAGYTYVTINNGSNGTALSFRESNTERAALFYSHGDNTLNLWGIESGSAIRFATSDSEKVRITSGGNVGIGTTSPNGKLQFAADINARKVVLYEGANNDFQFYGFGVLGATLLYSTYSTGDDHVFAVGQTSTTRKELARINSTYNALQVPGQPGFKIAWANRDATGSDRVLGTNQGDSLAPETRDTFNQGSHYSTSTGRFTCPVAGMYLFGFSVMRNVTNGTVLDIRIRKNGVFMYARAYAGSYTSAYQQGITVTITDAAANDYFDFFVNGSTSIYNDDTYVFGYLIG